MANTLYGCFLVQQKWDAEQAYWKMSAEEKVDFKHEMVESAKVGADNEQSMPLSLTSM
jgi:hypothetical protein